MFFSCVVYLTFNVLSIIDKSDYYRYILNKTKTKLSIKTICEIFTITYYCFK